ncbi:hypothetical protein N8A98_22200 [Devosia neptuniae]|uniref:Uncharacterized protein n=1 Tax=Devosia neptuniae TaxID=191302 RepID=A0ABY6CCC9_9HYPH|nr:hypothetical protein [Devosia neptuniae]UXN69885.1 hypothetical protein N8A98_22200 [Devosia neptuniae]
MNTLISCLPDYSKFTPEDLAIGVAQKQKARPGVQSRRAKTKTHSPAKGQKAMMSECSSGSPGNPPAQPGKLSEGMSSSNVNDPILVAIRKFRDSSAAFEAMTSPDTTAEIDAQVEQTYGPHEAILVEWTKPAQTHQGAVEALRLAVEQNSPYNGSVIADRMVVAALAYLDTVAA